MDKDIILLKQFKLFDDLPHLDEIFIDKKDIIFYSIITDFNYNTKECNHIETYLESVIAYNIEIFKDDFYFEIIKNIYGVNLFQYTIKKLFEKYCTLKKINEMDLTKDVNLNEKTLQGFTYKFMLNKVNKIGNYKSHCKISNSPININKRSFYHVHGHQNS